MFISEWPWKKLSWFAGCMALAALCVLTVFLARVEIKDMDLWLHMAVGRHILDTCIIPHHDILSCTITGKPWIDHEWLFQVIVAAVQRLRGFDGIVALQVGVIYATFVLLLFLGYRKDRQLGPLTVLFLVVSAYQGRMTHRPEIFSVLFFVTYVFCIPRFLTRPLLYGCVFLLQVAWTNMHGFFIMGPLLLAVGCLGEGLKRSVRLPYEWNRAGRLNDAEYRSLKILLGVSIAACLVNPFFLDGALYPLRVFFAPERDTKLILDTIEELQPPITWASLANMGHLFPFRMLILLSAGSFLYNRRKLDVTTAILWGLFLIFGLSAVRNIAFFSIAAYLAFVANTRERSAEPLLPAKIRSRRFLQDGALALMKVVLCLWIAQQAASLAQSWYYDFDAHKRKYEFAGGISLRNYPTKAVDFLVENRIKGNFFNDFNCGAYLEGRTFPGIKAFIDGRTEVFGPVFFKRYQAILNGNGRDFDAAADEFKLAGALVSYAFYGGSPKIIRHIYKSPRWALVYFNHDGVIFLRDIPQNAEIIRRSRIDLSQWTPPALDNVSSGRQSFIPYRQMSRAYVLYDLGFYAPARRELDQALQLLPNDIDAHRLLGKSAVQQEDFATAVEHLRFVTQMRPADREARYDLARAFYGAGKLSEAEEQCRRICESGCNDQTRILLMQIAASAGRHDAVCDEADRLKSPNDFRNELDGIVETLRNAGADACAEKIRRLRADAPTGS